MYEKAQILQVPYQGLSNKRSHVSKFNREGTQLPRFVHPCFYYRGNILRRTIIMTWTKLTSAKFFVSQKAQRHRIARRKRYFPCIIWNTQSIRKNFKSKNYDGRKIIGPLVVL